MRPVCLARLSLDGPVAACLWNASHRLQDSPLYKARRACLKVGPDRVEFSFSLGETWAVPILLVLKTHPPLHPSPFTFVADTASTIRPYGLYGYTSIYNSRGAAEQATHEQHKRPRSMPRIYPSSRRRDVVGLFLSDLQSRLSRFFSPVIHLTHSQPLPHRKIKAPSSPQQPGSGRARH